MGRGSKNLKRDRQWGLLIQRKFRKTHVDRKVDTGGWVGVDHSLDLRMDLDPYPFTYITQPISSKVKVFTSFGTIERILFDKIPHPEKDLNTD